MALNDNKWHVVTVSRPSSLQHTLLVDDTLTTVTSEGTSDTLDLQGFLYLGKCLTFPSFIEPNYHSSLTISVHHEPISVSYENMNTLVGEAKVEPISIREKFLHNYIITFLQVVFPQKCTPDCRAISSHAQALRGVWLLWTWTVRLQILPAKTCPLCPTMSMLDVKVSEVFSLNCNGFYIIRSKDNTCSRRDSLIKHILIVALLLCYDLHICICRTQHQVPP